MLTARTGAFCARFGLRLPLLLAPMAGVPAIALPVAVGAAGGMGALGALLLDAAQIADWVARYRAASAAPLQINLWVPDPAPQRDAAHEAAVRAFLAGFGPAVPASAGDTPLQDFDAQCRAVLAARPAAVSSIMGLFPPAFVRQLHAAGIAWFATATTVAEARAAEAAGADVVVAQGAEAGGHRGAFVAAGAVDRAVGLFALLPQVVDAVRVPVVATGGIADARGVAAALLLGASAVQIGTGFLRCPEAGIAPVWAQALQGLAPEDTQLTRAFSGRWGRALATTYVRAAAAPDAPPPAPYPVQRGLSAAMKKAAEAAGDVQRMQAWAGQGAGLSQALPAAEVTRGLCDGALALLGPR
ncbi:NAD(P)H-dependent flavin oxidoreductase [Rubrivivax sp. RP6-9]|uniref:NAD(P)H-dependent flavin oxidoreductase n=1 Tax=Rubrivivax sp. RP6-9 TaxID=3415750 RepID=UPI003CC57F0B